MTSSTDDKLERQLQLARELQASYRSKREHRGRNVSSRGRATRTSRNHSNAGGRENHGPPADTVRGRPRGSASRGYPRGASSRSRTRVGVTTFTSHVVVPTATSSSVENVPASIDQVSSTDKNSQGNVIPDLLTYDLNDSTKHDSSTDGCSQGGVFPLDSRRAMMKSYPPGHGLASSCWAPPGEDYCAPFTYPEIIQRKGPSTAFSEGEDLIDMFSPPAPSKPAANTPSVAAVNTTHASGKALMVGPTEMTNRLSETFVSPKVHTETNQSSAPVNAPKPFKGLASSRWAN